MCYASPSLLPISYQDFLLQPFIQSNNFALLLPKMGLFKTKFFTQILDHFNYNPKSYHKFQQRYLINDTYWGGAKKKAPIFVYTGNEGNIEWFTQNTSFMFEKAPYFKAILVFIEHRFYGKSIPFGGNKTIAYANSSTLGYLSSTQVCLCCYTCSSWCSQHIIQGIHHDSGSISRIWKTFCVISLWESLIGINAFININCLSWFYLCILLF